MFGVPIGYDLAEVLILGADDFVRVVAVMLVVARSAELATGMVFTAFSSSSVQSADGWSAAARSLGVTRRFQNSSSPGASAAWRIQSRYWSSSMSSTAAMFE